ncbi:L-arabinose isomerase [Bacillus sp. DNRA2]|uniref:L-arabinose isomerase n=1 Tax=Bacillus sp. DNRA2 TaxID=2723053 RepID=UPI00145DE21F|nr:L-arabinose isomerase [Bacillus sp. DNRA2]NMD70395.1 L-arabinose isomerase [Bacillus sp. DNRA2]
MIRVKPYQFWFVTGSQQLYGEDVLSEVEINSKVIVETLNKNGHLPYNLVFKGVLTNAKEVDQLILTANYHEECAGLVTWMHTFSPGKMWITGLSKLQKPLLHFHTQFIRDIPWDSIDMDYMNLHQSAHGDREYGYTVTRLMLPRKVIFGYWEQELTQKKMGDWMKTAVAVFESGHIRVARFGDIMRTVAVTDGDKLEAHIKFGWTLDYYGIGDLVDKINTISKTQVEELFYEYQKLYVMDEVYLQPGPLQDSIKEQARIELGLRAFLEEGDYNAFTTNFEDLHGMKQLPGLAVQRLMAEGYGFAAEGDWKTAALTRLIKILTHNQNTSFIEDYTYHLNPENEMTLGSHMLEVCPSIATETPKLVVQPLSIGNKEDPARLIFDGKSGLGYVVSLVDMGGRFRLVVNEIIAVQSEELTPNLPVAKVFWRPIPSLTTATEAWIYSGGSHHSVFSLSVTKDQLFDFAEMLDIECIIIDQDTDIRQLRQELKLNEMYWKIRK